MEQGQNFRRVRGIVMKAETNRSNELNGEMFHVGDNIIAARFFTLLYESCCIILSEYSSGEHFVARGIFTKVKLFEFCTRRSIRALECF